MKDVIIIKPDYKVRIPAFTCKNMATQIYRDKRKNKHKQKLQFKKYLRDNYGL
jgi:hypothetical protein